MKRHFHQLCTPVFVIAFLGFALGSQIAEARTQPPPPNFSIQLLVSPDHVNYGQAEAVIATVTADKDAANYNMRFAITQNGSSIASTSYTYLDFAANQPLSRTYSWTISKTRAAGSYNATVEMRKNGIVYASTTLPFMIDPTNGQCGAANGVFMTAKPTTDLCSAGQLASMKSVTSTSSWTWLCTGYNSGTTASCATATKPVAVNGQCGSANGVSVSSAPSTNLCTTGMATTVAGTGPWSWSCNGSNGGTNASCSAPLTPPPVNGICGSSNGLSLASAPTTNLCTSGTSTTVAGTGPWTWSCTGANGGTNASCSASLASQPINGSCGSANGTTVPTAPTTNLCSAGTSTAVAGTGPWTWSCTGANGGTNASCSAKLQVAAAPITIGEQNVLAGDDSGNGNLMVAQQATLSVPGIIQSLSFYVTQATGNLRLGIYDAKGPSGGPGTKMAETNEITPTAGWNTATVTSQVPLPPGNYWLAYLPSSGGLHFALTNGTGSFAWYNYNYGAMPATFSTGPSMGTGHWSFYASLYSSTAPLNGACGSSSGASSTTAPTTNLCSTGTATTVSGTGPWTWSCTGFNGGSSASCMASVQPLNAQCGSANNVGTTSAPSSGLCSAGTASAVTGTGPWSWSCNGANGGTSATCSAPLTVYGVCGSASGVPATSAPTSGLCSTGTPSTVSGTGPWNWTCSGNNPGTTAYCSTSSGACYGSVIPATPNLIVPPSVPQPVNSNDIVGVNIQNTGSTPLSNRYITFGQTFAYGKVLPSDRLVARALGTVKQVQMDPQALWTDGSVKLASITMAVDICAKSSVPVLLSKATASDPTFPTTPISLTLTQNTLLATLNFTSGAYSGTQQVNLGSALQLALNNKPDYWLHGPLATQARVDVPLNGGPLHLTADVTAYADGNITADVQFNNDLTTVISKNGTVDPGNPLPALKYAATISFQGQQVSYPISQVQYADWHTVLYTNGAPNVNVQHDLAYLEHNGFVLPYDRTTGVYSSVIADAASCASTTPLAENCVTPNMPMAGGRYDIGYTTFYNTAWLLTQDARIAAVGLAQSDTSGAVPWNYKLPNGHWLTPADSPDIWTDGRGGPRGGTDGVANLADDTEWEPEAAHQPELNYVPYIMTSARWNLDRLNAQASFSLHTIWPYARCAPNGDCSINNDIIMNFFDQVRQQGWSMRELMLAAFIGKTGSWELTYYNKVVSDNWAYFHAAKAGLTAAEGETAGWIDSAVGLTPFTKEWMQDYTSGSVVWGALMGFTGAMEYIDWQRDSWLAGRFIAPGQNPYDGCTYQIDVKQSDGSTPYATWAAVKQATVAAGDSYGTPAAGTWNVAGDYCQLARAVLGGALTLFPTDTKLQQALQWLNAAGAANTGPNGTGGAYIGQEDFRYDPTFNVVPMQ